MKEGQQFGPFVIEKVLGSGAMGTVYRARYTKTGARVALKLVAPGLTDNEGSLARFDREAKILKQLHHPNIVRFYGAGKDRAHNTPFYFMEYVEGESLDRSMGRRGRLTWEQLVALGQQLCSALQHAHEHGIIHRDLKPSNLMVLPDGTVKLTDFGIAKDMDVTALTAANCTVGTASYMSPEQCRGERDLTAKSDLYSLGVLFYELLTGRKPFQAETPMEMFMQHINGTFERPSRLVLDTPVWLDTLVCQMLEKKPEHRPRDAAMVAEALSQVAEKVAAQQSAGVDAARARAVDRPRGAAPADETDKEVARTLRQLAGRKKGKKRRKPVYRQVWIQAPIFALLLLVAVGALYYALTRKPSADQLYKQAEPLMLSSDPDEWEKANDPHDGPLTLYFRYYGKRDDEQAKKVREWSDKVEVYDRERLLERMLDARTGRSAHSVEPQPGVQKTALDAAGAENDGDLTRARKLWEEAQQKYRDERAWSLIADRRLKEIKEAEELSARFDYLLKSRGELHAGTDTERLAAEGLKCERDAGKDRDRVRDCWEKMRKRYQDDDEHRVLFLLAGKRARDIDRKPEKPEGGAKEEAGASAKD
jgi:eukaryotic-like serine/threonine-protein kinase